MLSIVYAKCCEQQQEEQEELNKYNTRKIRSFVPERDSDTEEISIAVFTAGGGHSLSSHDAINWLKPPIVKLDPVHTLFREFLRVTLRKEVVAHPFICSLCSSITARQKFIEFT